MVVNERKDQKDHFYFQWHITEECNLRCVHCYQEGYKVKALDKDKLLKIAKTMDNTLEKWNKKGRVSITGGEPFLKQDILLDLLSYFEKSNNFYWVGILSNGTLIDDELAAQLKRYNKLKEIQISIDGYNADTHDKIRGIGSFDKAVKAIEIIKRNKFFVSIMFTLHRLNVRDAVAVMDLAKELEIDALTIERITPMNDEDINNFYIPSDELYKIYKQIYEKKKKVEQASDLRVRVSRPLWGLIDNQLGGFCPVGLTSLCILNDGTVLPCRRLEIPVGNILTDGLFKIWYTSEVLWKLRNKKLLGGKCKNCSILANCGGCRAIAYTVNGNYMADDPQCWK
ncbi:MAG: hypothetical protein APF76_10955 [Desulfitibacter sp. BRH_c19]|nr:MAG: hypothetical protein APF76_10955 [Desulfitibacter sp. BRH_c19]